MNCSPQGRRALVLLEMQKASDADPAVRPVGSAFEANARRLLQAWREAADPVIHVQRLSRDADSPYRPGHPGFDFKDRLAPAAGEMVVQSQCGDAFVDSGLAAALRDRQADTLVVAGRLAESAARTTLRSGCALGFRILLVADATDGPGREDLEAAATSSERGLGGLCLIDTDEALSAGATGGGPSAAERLFADRR